MSAYRIPDEIPFQLFESQDVSTPKKTSQTLTFTFGDRMHIDSSTNIEGNCDSSYNPWWTTLYKKFTIFIQKIFAVNLTTNTLK